MKNSETLPFCRRLMARPSSPPAIRDSILHLYFAKSWIPEDRTGLGQKLEPDLVSRRTGVPTEESAADPSGGQILVSRWAHANVCANMEIGLESRVAVAA